MDFDQTEIGQEDQEVLTMGTRTIPLSVNPDLENQARATKLDQYSKTNKTENAAWKAACKKYIALNDLISQAPGSSELEEIRANSLINLSAVPLNSLNKKQKMICFRSMDPEK